MSIFDEFVNAITGAIKAYEDEKKNRNQPIHKERAQDILALKRILAKTSEQITVIRMRAEIIAYLDEMSITLAGYFWSLFDSALRKKIFSTLAEYPKAKLYDQTQLELQKRQDLLGQAEDGRNLFATIETLTQCNERLKERTEQALKQNKALDEILEKVTEQHKAVIAHNTFLQQEVKNLQEQIKQILTDHAELVKNQEKIILQLKEAQEDKDFLITELKKDKSTLQSNLELSQSKTHALKIEYVELNKKYDVLEKNYQHSLKEIKKLKENTHSNRFFSQESYSEEEMLSLNSISFSDKAAPQSYSINS